MANGNGKEVMSQHWTLVLPVGALTLLGTLMLVVSKDASIALDVARQHGEEILLLRGELVSLQNEIKDRTRSRYTAEDAARDLGYLREDVAECKDALKAHNGEHRNKGN